jgi:hypothetical protein
VKNVGQSIARNFTFKFSPPIESTWDGKPGGGEYRVAELEMFAAASRLTHPQRSTRRSLTSSRTGSRLVFPADTKSRSVMRGPNGGKYTDRQALSLDHYVGLLLRAEQKGIHELATTLDKMRREIRRWAANGGGLHVATYANTQARFTRFKEAGKNRSHELTDPDHGSDEEAA